MTPCYCVIESLRTLNRLRIRVSLTGAELAMRRAAILSVVNSLEIVEIDALVLDRASQPMPTELGTFDAIHLATALLWNDMTGAAPILATHDRALAIAGYAHGLRVIGAPAPS
jgi:predicted nucleic acid-binding protein